MKILIWVILISTSFMLSGCGPEDDKDGGTLAINFTLTYGSQPMKMYESYIYPSPQVEFQFSRLSFFLHQMNITDAEKNTQIQDVDYINLTNAYIDPVEGKGQILEIENIPSGMYNSISFDIGLPSSLNSKSPVDFESGHVLSSNAEYWTSWKSYIFFKCEGLIADQNDPNNSIPIALHLGGNFALLPISLDKNFEISDGKTTTITINIDLNRFFGDDKIYDIYENPQLHSLNQQPYIEELVKNLEIAIK
ncbi:MAG: MbnP family protein [Saprospiraceae bacterium]